MRQEGGSGEQGEAEKLSFQARRTRSLEVQERKYALKVPPVPASANQFLQTRGLVSETTMNTFCRKQTQCFYIIPKTHCISPLFP